MTRINNAIRVNEVRVILEDRNLGIIKIQEARSLAEKYQLDLVEVSPEAKPPVCKIMDYGKYVYEQKKKTKQTQNKSCEAKEVRLTAGTEQHDIDTKLGQIRKFLTKGHQVKIVLRFKRRQIAHVDEGKKIMEFILNSLNDIGKTDRTPQFEGRQLVVQVNPL